MKELASILPHRKEGACFGIRGGVLVSGLSLKKYEPMREVSNMKNSIVSLLKAIERDRGFILEVESIIKAKDSGLVFIKMNTPLRIVKMTEKTFSRIEPFLMQRRTKC